MVAAIVAALAGTGNVIDSKAALTIQARITAAENVLGSLEWRSSARKNVRQVFSICMMISLGLDGASLKLSDHPVMVIDVFLICRTGQGLVTLTLMLPTLAASGFIPMVKLPVVGSVWLGKL